MGISFSKSFSKHRRACLRLLLPERRIDSQTKKRDDDDDDDDRKII